MMSSTQTSDLFKLSFTTHKVTVLSNMVQLRLQINHQLQFQKEVYTIQIQFSMGAQICSQNDEDKEKDNELFPTIASFTPITEQVELKPEHHQLLDSIKNHLQIIDPRPRNNLFWFQSVKYNLYLYGKLERQRPIGDCFFYTKNPNDEETPIMIATNINQHYVFSERTLIVYRNNIVYYGAIKNNIATIPRAEGQGTLFSPHFIYKGQFKMGAPHGFGHYRSKSLEYLGEFKNGIPMGEGIEKTSSQLFVGTLYEDNQRKGFKITDRNQKIEVQMGSPQKGSQSVLKSFKDHVEKEGEV